MSKDTSGPRTRAAVPARRSLQSALTLLTILVAALSFGPAPAAAAGSAQAEFCDAWASVRAGDDSLVLSTGVKIEADRLNAEGATCDSADAAITSVAPKLSDAPSGPAGTGAVQALASVFHAAGGTSLEDGTEVFQGAYLANFGTYLTPDLKLRINGRIVIDFSQTSTQFSFDGVYADTTHYSMTVYSTPEGTKLPNVTGSPLLFSGQFARSGATYSLDLKADAPNVTLGEGDQQLSLRSGKLALALKDEATGSGLQLAASGQLGIGSNVTVDGAITADLDATGLKSFTGSGGLAVTVPASGSAPAGSISGSATIGYTREPLARSISFTGALSVGDAVVTGASGTIDDVSASFTGNVAVRNADLGIKGGVDGIAYFGSNLTGRTIQNHAGVQVPAQTGDLLLKAAGGEVTWNGVTLAGTVQFGSVGAQTWSKAGGSVALTIPAPGQPDTTVKGGAELDWLKGSTPAVTFEGSITSGSTEVASAKGTFDGKKLSFAGQVTLANPDLTIKGAIDGVVYYGSDLAGETVENHAGAAVQASPGDFALRSASASLESKGFKLTGAVSLGRVGGERWAIGGGSVDVTYGPTRLNGTAQLDWVAGQVPGLTFSGEITSGDTTAKGSGTVDGKKVLFEGSVTSPTVEGRASGGVYYGADLAGEQITNKSGTSVQAKPGDFYLAGSGVVTLKQFDAAASFTVKSVSGVTWLETDARIKVARTYLTFSGTIDSLGNVDLRGSGSVNFDGTTVQFSGSAVVQSGRVVISGSGTVKTGLFAATLTGTIEKPSANSSAYVLTGSANFKFGTIQVVNASVRLTVGEGLTTAFNVRICFLWFICPNATYKLYFSGGNVSRAELNAPIAWAAQFLGFGAIVLGPNVPISTKITGLI